MKKIFVLLLLSLGLNSNHALASDGAGSFWSKIAQSFASAVGSVNIESAALGVDKGIISQFIIGMGRTVERNPKAQGKNDQFLVKDRLRIGMELGAGFVVAGTVTYAQEWTLVYPVATEFQGYLSRKFILDLFLPLTVGRLEESALPDEYVVIRESFIEGKGRLKLGDLPAVLLGSQHSVGKVKLASTFTKRFPNQTYKVMREKSDFTRVAHELWFNFAIADIPIFDGFYSKGASERTFYEIDYDHWSDLKKQELFQSVFRGILSKDTEPEYDSAKGTVEEYLIPFKLDKKWESYFYEENTNFTLFALFNKDTFSRTDDLRISENGEESTWWQWENRVNVNWTIGIREETYKTKILISGKKEDQNLIDPILSINIILNDSNTTEKEMDNNYLTLVNDFLDYKNLNKGEREQFEQYKIELNAQNCIGCFPNIKTYLTLQAFYDHEQLNTMIQATSKDWKKAIAQTTEKDWSYWDRAINEKFHSVDRRRMRQSRIPLSDISLGKQIKHFMNYMERAKKEFTKNPLKAYRLLAWAFRTSFYVNNIRGHNILILRAMNHLIEEKMNRKHETYINHRLYTDSGLYSQAYFETRAGLIESIEQQHFPYILEDPSEIFYFF